MCLGPAFKQTLQHPQLNTFESVLDIRKWTNLNVVTLRQRQGVIHSDSINPPGVRLDDESTIPIAYQGLKILGCTAGANTFCAAQLDLLCRDIENDL